MMNESEITTRIKAILHERFGLDAATLTDATRLRDLGIDSLHLVDVIFDLETELGITIEDLSLPPETTLGALGNKVALVMASGVA